MTLELTIRQLVADKLCVDLEKVTLEARLVEDLGADSLDGTELMIVLEEKFDLVIQDGEAKAMRTVGDIIKFLQSKGIPE
ncbi:MAG: acyl carrier protein [Patescibacteria group bacterium]